MRTLIVGIGALGGTIAARASSNGIPVWLATRSMASAEALKSTGLRLSGIGGPAEAQVPRVASLDHYQPADQFDLILLATKAQDALDTASALTRLLAPEGVVLPIQNGGVSQLLTEKLGDAVIVGGLSNLGASMLAPGIFEQRNDGHLLIGELAGGSSPRVDRIAQFLRQAIEVRTTANLRGAIWSKILINCSVTTLGAVAGQTMRQYITTPSGREIFRRIYDETLTIALAEGAKPERMLVEPIPPGWNGASVLDHNYDTWIAAILAAYGDLKPSMLQDFERGRRTEIDFINGYVAQLGIKHSLSAVLNAAATELVHVIEAKRIPPGLGQLDGLLKMAGYRPDCQ